jgi:xanthine dehydrogenase YagT iron-sulfur-binding subunit
MLFDQILEFEQYARAAQRRHGGPGGKRRDGCTHRGIDVDGVAEDDASRQRAGRRIEDLTSARATSNRDVPGDKMPDLLDFVERRDRAARLNVRHTAGHYPPPARRDLPVFGQNRTMHARRTGQAVTRGGFLIRISASALVLRLTLKGAVAAQPETGMQTVPATSTTFDVNGMQRTLSLDQRVTLLDALRDHLQLTGTKKGCDQGTCGACTVLVNGRRILSCLTLAAMHAGDRITTIEGIAKDGQMHPLQSAFISYDAFQCGYCTPGQIMSAAGMLSEGHHLDRQTVAAQMSGNICRCSCYPQILDAILHVGRPS